MQSYIEESRNGRARKEGGIQATRNRWERTNEEQRDVKETGLKESSKKVPI